VKKIKKNTEIYLPGGLKEVIQLAWPLVLSTASYSIMHFCDRMMLTRYSDTTAAASTAAGILSFAFLSFFLGISGYTNTFIAQYHGAGEKKLCTICFWQGVYFSIVAGILYPILLKPLGAYILNWTAHEPAVLAAEQTYFGLLAFGAIFPLVGNSFSSFFSGRGDTRTIMWVSIAMAILNIFLNYGLIFGKMGFPEMGIAGAAIATIAGSICGTVLYIFLISKKRFKEEYGIWKFIKFKKSTFLRLIKFGGPSGFSFGLEVTAFAFVILLIGKLGNAELIATNITFAINSLAFLPMLGLSFAATILVGKYIGEEKKEVAEKAAYSSVKIALIYMVAMGIIFIIFPKQFFNIFKGEGVQPALFDKIYGYGKNLLIIIAVLGAIDSIHIVFSAALNGAGDTWFVMWIKILVSWVIFIPAVFLGTVVYKMSLYWSWGWFLVFVTLLALIFWKRFAAGHWKSIEIREKTTPAILPEAAGETVVVD